MTDPAWEPIMKRAAAIVTDRGGRTCHSAIISRELGLPCIVGTGNATQVLQSGADVTVSCSEGAHGNIYEGRIDFAVDRRVVGDEARPRTQVMMNVGDPDHAFAVASLPNDGVGLARLEFMDSPPGDSVFRYSRFGGQKRTTAPAANSICDSHD